MKKHTLPVRIYYEDTDAGGIVYHANYLNFCERARCEMLRELGFECLQMAREKNFGFVVKHADIEYHQPAVLDDALEVVTTIKKMKNSSFLTHHSVQKQGVSICDIFVTLVCIDTNAIKPVPILPDLRAAFEPYLEEDK